MAHAGGTLLAEETVRGAVPARTSTTIADTLPGADSRHRNRSFLGRTAAGGHWRHRSDNGDSLTITPPSWRPDLNDPYDYVEEVGRLIGFDTIEPVVPTAPVGRGLTQKPAGTACDQRRAGRSWIRRGIELPVCVGDRPGSDGRAGRRPTSPTEQDRQPAVGSQSLPAHLHAARACSPQP